jgi:hypothetical protein
MHQDEQQNISSALSLAVNSTFYEQDFLDMAHVVPYNLK